MLRVGITGGIGSGKSLVCDVFRVLGVPVSNADDTARWLMENDSTLISDIKKLFGESAYQENKLNRAFLAQQVFSQPEQLSRLNAVVHPAVVAFGDQWFSSQTTPYAIKEAAIFFESNTHSNIDVMIGVRAPESVRLKRVMQRNNTTEAEVRARMDKQMPEEEKMKRCDFVIDNDDQTAVLPQVLQLHQTLLQKAKGR